MIKAVLFDLDGTLLNRDESLKRFIDDQYVRLKKHLGHISKTDYIKRFIELDHHGYVWKDKVYAQLIQEFNISEITWEEMLNDYMNSFKYSCVPFANLTEMLDMLKSRGILLGIITNGHGEFQMSNIKALGIEWYFDEVLVSGWEGIKKPDSEIFRRALERIGTVPEQAIFVGDHPMNDVKAARSLGMKGVWKKDSQWTEVDADYVIEDLCEIPRIVSELN